LSADARIARGSEPLVLERKAYEMIEYGYVCLRQFPNSEKHTLAAEIKSCMFTILRFVIRARRQYYKKTTLQDLDIENHALMTLVRLAKDLSFLAFKRYEVWAGMIVEIGKMVGGWIKHQSANHSGR